MKLVKITEAEFDVELDIRYATNDNITGKPLYKKAEAYLHPVAAEKLKTAIAIAKAQGLRFKIFDAYRPLEIQQALWNHTPDPEFLSNPETGSVPHCRGVAIDLTLLDTKGSELDMGTGFDEFSPKSHHGVFTVSKKAQANRLLLMGIMTTADWDFYRNEWWHYQLFTPREYPVLSDKDAGTRLV